MITTILIVLVAVVVLIVIIAVLALRYLRADDSDTFDDIPDEPRPRRAPERDSGPHPVRPHGRQRQPEPVTAARAAGRPVRAPADARGQQPGYRDRDTGQRPAVPERAGSPAGGQRRPAAVPQSARAARADDSDSWESLSDVDYWAELSADKPSAAAAPSRRTADGPPADPRPASLPRHLPSRPVGAPAGRGAEPVPGVPPGVDAPGRRSGSRLGAAPRPAAQRPAPSARPPLPQRQQLPAAQAPPGNGHARPVGPADDDPLTSPSFPAINAADSRSYRTRRSAHSQPGSTGPHSYPAGPDRISRPEGYPVQAPAPQAPPAPQVQAPPSRSSAPPAANPYGSYVSAPSAYPPPGYPDPAATSRAPADPLGYPAASQPAAASNWYPPPAFEQGGATGSGAADGYLPAAGLGAASQSTGRHAHGRAQNGSVPRGYAEIDYNNLRYDDPVYPDTEAAGVAGYAGPGAPTRQYEQQGYGGPDLGYGQDGYSGYGTGGR
jgi:hypothetical protein